MLYLSIYILECETESFWKIFKKGEHKRKPRHLPLIIIKTHMTYNPQKLSSHTMRQNTRLLK